MLQFHRNLKTEGICENMDGRFFAEADNPAAFRFPLNAFPAAVAAVVLIKFLLSIIFIISRVFCIRNVTFGWLFHCW
jgi:hypothetical protein